MKENGLTAYVGPPGGYVLRFSNGLTVYLSGDTGVTAEQEATKGGEVQPKTKTATFQKAVKVPSYPSLSGKTMEFDGSAKCVAGC
jgi:hypothetical protein